MNKKYFHRLKDSKEIVYLNISRIETRRIQLNMCVLSSFMRYINKLAECYPPPVTKLIVETSNRRLILKNKYEDTFHFSISLFC
jgi:hypothetical protein